MKILYVFPHPDDESFGPASAIHQQLKAGHEVILLTFTKGGASKVRHQLGLTVDQMGELREKEMQRVSETLGLSAMTVLDYEDGGLAYLNPNILLQELEKWILFYKPGIVITYPVHGGSGHHDHIALHHVVKSLFYQGLQHLSFWRRLAFFTVIHTEKPMFLEGGVPRVTQTSKSRIAVDMTLNEADIEAMKAALLCYETYQQVVISTNVIERIGNKAYFELAGEEFDSPLTDLTEKIGEKDPLNPGIDSGNNSALKLKNDITANACCGGAPANNSEACCKLDEDKKAAGEIGCGCHTANSDHQTACC